MIILILCTIGVIALSIIASLSDQQREKSNQQYNMKRRVFAVFSRSPVDSRFTYISAIAEREFEQLPMVLGHVTLHLGWVYIAEDAPIEPETRDWTIQLDGNNIILTVETWTSNDPKRFPLFRKKATYPVK